LGQTKTAGAVGLMKQLLSDLAANLIGVVTTLATAAGSRAA
jgi:hypothetical protein